MENEKQEIKPVKLSELCKPARRILRDWVVIVLLALCCPFVSGYWLQWIPGFLFWIPYIGLALVVNSYMWLSRKWPVWLKLVITLSYVICYFIK